MKLTPAMLAGKAYTETVQLKDGDNIYEIEIRPLTHLEKAQVQAIETASVKINNKSGKITTQAMEMHDYTQLTEIQKTVLIEQWNREMKEQERQIKKGGSKRGKRH